MARVSEYLDRIGVAGSAFASLCCLGTPALLSLVSAVGLGFLINDAVLLPLMVVFLGVNLYGLRRSYARHRKSYPLMLGGLSALGLFTGVLLFGYTPMVYASLAGLVGASLWDMIMKRSCAPAVR